LHDKRESFSFNRVKGLSKDVFRFTPESLCWTGSKRFLFEPAAGCFWDPLLLLIGLGAFSLRRIEKFHDLLNDVSLRWAPGLRELNDVGANSERYRNLQGLTLLTKDPVLKEGVLKRFSYVKNLRQDAWGKHVAALQTPSNKELAETVANAWSDYMTLSETLMGFHLLDKTIRPSLFKHRASTGHG
jgi:hypothetical protein